jgi:hypothetical protein
MEMNGEKMCLWDYSYKKEFGSWNDTAKMVSLSRIKRPYVRLLNVKRDSVTKWWLRLAHGAVVQSPEPKSQDIFRSGLALDPDYMYGYCVQYTYTDIKLIFSTLNKEH